MPESYHFEKDSYHRQTTSCFIKGESIRRLLSFILFLFYATIVITECIWFYSNVRNWRKCYRLVQYLPIEDAFDYIRDNSLTDLHLILAIVELNGRSNQRYYKAISLVYEVLSALHGDEEIQNFLPVFSEVIIWGATDEGVDELIDKMANKE